MDPKFKAYLDNIQAKTGKTPDDFKALAEHQGLLVLAARFFDHGSAALGDDDLAW